MMLILSGKSGCGKTTIREKLIKEYGFEKAISHTTRTARADDIPDGTYHFVSEKVFKEMLDNDEFVEYTVYDGNYYGLSKTEAEKESVIAILDTEGVRSAKKLGLDVIVIYLDSASDVRVARLLDRGDAPERVFARLKSDTETFAEINRLCDYVVPADGSIENTVNSVLHKINSDVNLPPEGTAMSEKEFDELFNIYKNDLIGKGMSAGKAYLKAAKDFSLKKYTTA